MVSERTTLREWITDFYRNDGLHKAEAETVADFVVSHPEVNSGRIENESQLRELIKQELRKTSLCSSIPSEEEFTSLIQQVHASDSQLFAEDSLETVEMTLIGYRNDFIEGKINPDSENHPVIEITSSKHEAVELFPDPYAQEITPLFGSKIEEIDWDHEPEEGKQEAENSTNKFLTEDIDNIPAAEDDTTEEPQMSYQGMSKQTIIHLHWLLSQVADHLKEKGEMSDNWRPDRYEQLSVRPTSIHRSPQEQAKAVNLLASSIAGELRDSVEAETSNRMPADDS